MDALGALTPDGRCLAWMAGIMDVAIKTRLLGGMNRMSILWRAVTLFILVLFLTTSLAQTSYAGTPIISGVTLTPPTVQLFGNVILVDGYALPSSAGCYAVIEVVSPPLGGSRTILVRTSEQRLQSLLVAALTAGNQVSIVGEKVSLYSSRGGFYPPPRGGTWNIDVYNIDEVTLYNWK